MMNSSQSSINSKGPNKQMNSSIDNSDDGPFISSFSNLIEDQTIDQIIDSQRNMLTRFEKTNEMLVNCNALAMIRFENSSRELRKHTQQLIELKKDLDLVFKRIRFLKFKLSQQYPQAFKACSVSNVLEEEEDESTTEIKNQT